MKFLYKTVTSLILLLGMLHVGATPCFFSSFTIDTVWFVAGGLVLVLNAAINFLYMKTFCAQNSSRFIFYSSNLISLVYTILIVSVLSDPQAFVALILLVCETVIAFIYKPGIESV